MKYGRSSASSTQVWQRHHHHHHHLFDQSRVPCPI